MQFIDQDCIFLYFCRKYKCFKFQNLKQKNPETDPDSFFSK